MAQQATRDRAGGAGQTVVRRRAMRLAVLIIVWDVIEGAVAVTAGLAAGSIALIGFGIDSSIEVFAASVVVWELRGGGSARRRRVALQLIGATFFVLAAYVSFEAVRDLVTGDRAGESIVGIVLNTVALVVMVPVAVAQRRTGRALRNDVVLAQSQETWMSNYLSIGVLAGLGANAVAGWWWADPLVALGVAALAVKSGADAWRESNETP